MKRLLCALLAVCMLLCGCEVLITRDSAVEPHSEENIRLDTEDVTAAVYWQLRKALTDMVASGVETGLIYVADYDPARLEEDIATAVEYTTTQDPIGAYALEKIHYELGTSSGKAAVALELHYIHDRAQIMRIREFDTMMGAWDAVVQALANCDASLVMKVNSYAHTDYVQLIQDYAYMNPQVVMEVPQVDVGVYPEEGDARRVVELKFTYQTSRDILRAMQGQVQPVFASAELYVSGDGEAHEKLSQLYSFLTERFDYQLQTSLTPAYSLLRHGVGDSRAFATVYAAMCRNAGLECDTVSGTRDGEAWYWNIVLDGDVYYHVDLLRCMELGDFRELTDAEMTGYVWDYSAYPSAGGEVQEPVDVTVPVTSEPEKNS